MKKIPSKTDIRNELRKQVDEYLSQGGEVQQVAAGVSGRDDPRQGINTPIFNEPKTSRTPIPEVIEALDSRRMKKAPTANKPRPKKPKEKVIYDDFGEPLRKVWVDQ